jgi:hypothetical protein
LTSDFDQSITCTLEAQLTCHNLAIPLTPSHVTTVSGCNSETDFDILRTGECLATEWKVHLPPCVRGLSGALVFDFLSDESRARDTSDTFEVLVDGVTVDTWVNDNCHFSACEYSVPWYETSRTLEVRSASARTSVDQHASIRALRFEQQGHCNNFALPLTPDFVTTVSGCNNATNHDALRTGDCTSTEWDLHVPTCMRGTAGLLQFDFRSDERADRDRTDVMEVWFSGCSTVGCYAYKAAAFVNDVCNPKSCQLEVPWTGADSTLTVRSRSSKSDWHYHALIFGVKFQKKAPTSAPPAATPETYCGKHFHDHGLVCGFNPDRRCILYANTTNHDGSRGSCRRWCQSQGRRCVDAADNYGWPNATCVVETHQDNQSIIDLNAGRDSCDSLFLDQLCVCA